MNPLMDWWELVWTTYKQVVTLAWAMGGLWGLLIVVLATVAAFAAGVVAPLVVLGGLVALVFTVGMKAAVAVLFLYLFATLLSAPNRPRTAEEVQAFMRANPGLTAEEALARMPKPLRSRDTQERYKAHATADWHTEMQARKQALARYAATAQGQPLLTHNSFFYDGRWWWKPGQTLCRPFANPMAHEAVFPPGPLPQPPAPNYEGLADSPEHPNQPEPDPTTEAPVCDFVAVGAAGH